MENIKEFITAIDAKRMADDLWRLVNIPSPTCDERQAALAFAQMLTDAGAEVDIDETIYQSPGVIGHLSGNRPGKVFQLAGHIDHINIDHRHPEWREDIISGRGSADMKNGLAGMLEIIRILKQSNCDFPGQILVTVYGRHEAPDGDSKGLLNIIENGIKGDAALVLEGPCNAAMIMAKGQSIWRITLSRSEPSCHELNADSNSADLLGVALTLTDVLQQKSRLLTAESHKYPLLGPESLFIGQLHYGDFYNRLSNKCALEGTRRWLPDHSFEQVKNEFSRLLQSVNLPEGITIENDWIFVGESYKISEDEPVVKSLRKSYSVLNNVELKIGGTALVTDACRLVRYGSVPTVLWGFDTGTAHADYEFVEIEKMHKACQIVLYTILDYLNSEI